jgi:hypothetical protein
VAARLVRILLAAAALTSLLAPPAAAKLHVKGKHLVNNLALISAAFILDRELG